MAELQVKVKYATRGLVLKKKIGDTTMKVKDIVKKVKDLIHQLRVAELRESPFEV